jgi:Na+/H+-dicarboxylate symporter
MSYFKKNKLITFIILAMIAGLILGYFVNTSITQNKTIYNRNELNKITNPVVKEQVEKAIIKYEEKVLRESKKTVASRYSILSDIFLHLIKMIIAPLVLAVLVIGVAKVGDFKSVGRIGLKTLIYFTSATLIALALGLVIVNVFEPGKVMHLDLPDVQAETGIKANTQDAKNFTNSGFCIIFWSCRSRYRRTR